MPIDETRTFKPLNLAILTVSDSRTVDNDTSGDLLASRAEEAGHTVLHRAILPDDQHALEQQFRQWAADPQVQIILSTGGTGLTRRDVTPEAVEAVSTKLIPGFGELFRQISFGIIGVSTLQSRCIAGVCDQTLIFALPGSTSACRDGWDHILAYQLDSRFRPCNFAELLPRL